MHGPTEYRAGVGIVLVSHTGLVFAGRRRDGRSPPWQMPQGGLRGGESPVHAAFRELNEELGTDRAIVHDVSPDWIAYDYPKDSKSKRSTQFRGQRHLWFLMRFTGKDRDIRVSTAHPEFDSWQWMAADDLAARVTPFKQAVYRQVLTLFEPTIVRIKRGEPTAMTSLFASSLIQQSATSVSDRDSGQPE